MIGTFWSLVPAIVAICLALLTKEVYSSLFAGILVGAIFYTIDKQSGFDGLVEHIFTNGLIEQLSSKWNLGILVFLVLLGTIVALMNRAGGSAAFARWAKTRIKSKMGAQLATAWLGLLIFIDDYFNCLTVGSVMRPVTDKYKVSRVKLAYIIDSMAAPVCIIAPISSWAAAVSSFVHEGENGITLFCKAIPFNFYAILTIFMVFAIILMRMEYGPMAKYEREHQAQAQEIANEDEISPNSNGRVAHLVFPIILLIIFCVIGMLYTGGFFSTFVEENGTQVANPTHLNFIEALANSDASVGLMLGSFAAFVLTVVYYLKTKILSFKSCMACLPEGFNMMVSTIIILVLAWTLKGMSDSLEVSKYVEGVVSGTASELWNFLPAIVFLIACLIAFATGTSWGTFGILIPICVSAFAGDESLRIISISACMAGAVCGDHISPISDTTIMSSAGAQCNHIDHVSTQMPYALSVAFVSFFTYIVAGFTQTLGIWLSALISWVFGASILMGFLIYMKKYANSRIDD